MCSVTKGVSMSETLKNRASRNFEKYFNEFLQSGAKEGVGLPAVRLSKTEWDQLNNELADSGVTLKPREKNGVLYYWFSRLQKTTPNKTDDMNPGFKRGTENVFNLLLSKIRDKYPNLSDAAIIEMIKSRGETEKIYQILRYKQDGEYTDVSLQEFEDAFNYALRSAYNGAGLINDQGKIHHWPDSMDYINSHSARYMGDELWPGDRYIKMSGTQHWTWFRMCGGNTLPKVKDSKYPKGLHLSANVCVTKDLLRALDDILIADGGRYVDSYKFPKVSYYDEIRTRHDPITIYMNARNPELERRIVKVMRPFVRSNEGLTGEMLGFGVSLEPETSDENGGISVGQTISRDIAELISKYKDRI